MYSSSKVEILNDQFVSTYTWEDNSNIQRKGTSDHPTMDSIRVHISGILNLLRYLNTHTATGPDEFPAFILKSAARLDPNQLEECPHSPSLQERRETSTRSRIPDVLEYIVHSSVMDHLKDTRSSLTINTVLETNDHVNPNSSDLYRVSSNGMLV